MFHEPSNIPIIVTAGSTYLDIDAYACCVALAELLTIRGMNCLAYSPAPVNYSVCSSLIREGQLASSLPPEFQSEDARYIVVDVSDPDYIRDTVAPERVCAVFDHHVGFESYWHQRIGERACIEFIGAAATLIFRQWKRSGLLPQMSRSTSKLLVAAILDNTLDLTSSNTTDEDREAFRTLCALADVDSNWCARYFREVQENVEEDLRNALFHDLKTVREDPVLPPYVAQLCVWDARRILDKLPRIRNWFCVLEGSWMINIIDIQNRCSWFVCDDTAHQSGIQELFDISFQAGVARTPVCYLRKEIIRKTRSTITGG